MRKGTLLLGLRLLGTNLRVVHEARCPDIGPICDERDEPPQVHDQQFWVAELRMLAEYAVTEALSVEFQLPLRWTTTTITYRRLDGTPFVPEPADLHHRDETLVGVGDPWLSARLRAEVGGFLLSGQAGLSVPLGRTEPNPFALGRVGVSHQHQQFGTGTVDPLLGLEVSRAVGVLSLRLFALAQLSLYPNDKGYQAGSRFNAGLGLDWRVLPALQLGLSSEGVVELPERWDGQIEQDGSVGRADVLAGLTVRWSPGPLTVALSVRTPVFQHFLVEGERGGQLRYPVVLLLSVQRQLSVP